MYRLVSLIALLAIFTSMSQAQTTHIVDLAGTGDFTSIHEAVEAASAGDTIRVQPDQYAFTADLGPVVVDKRLVIIGSGYMPVEDGGTELIDIPGTGFFDLNGSADGTVIKGFRVQGATDFLDTEGGTAGVTIEENLFIDGANVLNFVGSADTVRSNVFYNTGWYSIYTGGANTQITNNLFTETNGNNHNTGVITVQTNGSGVVIAYNLFLGGRFNTHSSGVRVRLAAGAPEVYSNGFANGTNSNIIYSNVSSFITNNSFYNLSVVGLNATTDAPEFEDFDPDNTTLDLDVLDENSYDLSLADGSGWIDTGRTGTPYLDTDGSRSDIGIYAGPRPFSDGRGAPSVPVVIEFQVTPTTVSPTGTITITATGRIGDN